MSARAQPSAPPLPTAAPPLPTAPIARFPGETDDAYIPTASADPHVAPTQVVQVVVNKAKKTQAGAEPEAEPAGSVAVHPSSYRVHEGRRQRCVEWVDDPPRANPQQEAQRAREKATPPRKCVLHLFYATWCGYCKQFKPIWRAFVQSQLAGSAVLRASPTFPNIFAEEHESEEPNCGALMSKYGVRGFPTVILTDFEGNKLSEFNEQRTIEGLHRFCERASCCVHVVADSADARAPFEQLSHNNDTGMEIKFDTPTSSIVEQFRKSVKATWRLPMIVIVRNGAIMKASHYEVPIDPHDVLEN